MTADPAFELLLAPAFEELAGMRASLRAWLASAGIDATTIGDMTVAATELCTNGIEAGAGHPILVQGTLEPSEVVLTVTNRAAEPFELEGPVEPPPPDSARQRGLFLVQALVDELSISTRGRHTTAYVQRAVEPHGATGHRPHRNGTGAT